VQISIITPVLNKAAFINRCFESVARQSHQDCEHIIVDGGSTDGTVQLIQEYANQRPNVVWTSRRDRGQSHAMNCGLKMARGDVVGVLNADDYYEPDVLEVVDRFMTGMPRPAMLFGNCLAWNDAHEVRFENKPRLLDLIEWLLPDGDAFIPVNPVQYFYTTDIHSAVGYFDEDEHYVMDIDFLFRAIPVAHCQYVDRLFGHFLLVTGTKTLSDIEAGTADDRFMQLKLRYLQALPLRVRLLYELKQRFRRLAQRSESVVSQRRT